MSLLGNSLVFSLAVAGASLAGCGSDGGAGGVADAGETPDVGHADAGHNNNGTLVVTVDASIVTTTVRSTCAAADMLVVEPLEANVGQTIRLDASGVAPDISPSDVVLTWAATGSAGSLATSTGPSNTFSCASRGSSTVTVTASVPHGGASCVNTGSLSAVVSCD